MDVNIQGKEVDAKLDLPEEESECWHALAMHIFSHANVPEEGERPLKIEVSSPYGSGTVSLRARGTWFDVDGSEKLAPFVTYDGDDICPVQDFESYEPKHYVFCSPLSPGGHGSYKFYQMDVDEFGLLQTRYGRVGGGIDELFGGHAGKARKGKPVESSLYWLRHFEKLAKGYVDLSSVCLGGTEAEFAILGITPSKFKLLQKGGVETLADLLSCDLESVKGLGSATAGKIRASIEALGLPLLDDEEEAPKPKATESYDPEASADLYELLQGQSEHVIDRYVDNGCKPTLAMVSKSRSLLSRLASAPDVEAANRTVRELMCVSPRKADVVADCMISGIDELDAAVARETALADSLMASLVKGLSLPVEADGRTDFNSLGIDVRAASEEERREVLDLMHDPYSGRDEGNFADRVERVWRIAPAARLEAYESYKAKRGIKEEKLLFHGSSFGSWFSCVSTGLSTRYAGKCGSSLGKGLYFANQFLKSSRYTDGSTYRTDLSRKRLAYVGVYDVAYGKPYEVSRSDWTLNQAKIGECDCVHAYRGDGYSNDEIVVYDDDACVIKYLVEYRS